MDQPPNAPPTPPRKRRLLLRLAAALGLGSLVLASGSAWLLGTESGLQAALGAASQLSGGQLQVEGARGRLLGPLQLEQLRWHGQDQVQLQALELDWRPEALLAGQVHIQRLGLGALRLTPGPASNAAPPEQLTLPLGLQVDSLELGALYLGEDETPLITALEARLESDGQQHRLAQLEFQAGSLTLTASGQLEGQAPMQLQAQARLTGQLAEHPLELSLTAAGPLARLPLQGELQADGKELQTGRLEALLTPFAPQPLERLKLSLRGLDPARWQAGAPQARLDLEADLQPRRGNGAELALGGEIRLENQQPAGLDRQGLPLSSLRAGFHWQGRQLALQDLEVRFPGQGSYRGRLALDLGLGLGKSPEQGRTLSLSGQLAGLDPARLSAAWPRGRLEGSFASRIQLAPSWAESRLALEFQLRNSRLAGQACSGQGRLELAGERLQGVDLQLAAGPNRATARGDLGRREDRLQLDIQAPRLDSLGLPGQLGGDLEARLQLSGALAAPLANGSARSHRLTLPGGLQTRELSLETRLGSQPGDPFEARLQLDSLESPQGRLRQLQLNLSGQRRQHRLELAAELQLEGKSPLSAARLQAAASGSFRENLKENSWQGQLEQLRLTPAGQPPLAQLAAPAPLSLGPGRFGLGPALLNGQLEGAAWQARLTRLERQGQRWQSAGQLQALPLGPLLARVLPPPARTSLRLDGEWDLALGGKPQGSLRLSRRDGDLQLGAGPGTALGLSRLQLGLNLEGQPRLELQASGERLGQLQASARLAATDPLGGPWSGRVDARMADLAWLSPLLGPAFQLGGRLEAAATLAGTPQQPRLQGSLRGEALHLRALDQGLRLESGQLHLVFDEQQLRLEQFAFASPHGPLPRALDRDQQQALEAISARPGRITGQGQLRFGGDTGGELEFRLERLGVVQKPDQWVALSGQGQLRLTGQALEAGAQLQVDGAYWQLADAGAPQLSDDVVVRRASAPAPAPRSFNTSLDLSVDLGRAFHFAGAGVKSRLRGALRLQGKGQEPPRATGTIRTVDGRFDAYGQQLDIDQGILSFNGLVQNPGLNIRAMRRNQAVEAGVSITGTARKPVIKLVSTPNVPDAEKLSWLVLGEAPEQRSGTDYGTLLTAANAILGGQERGPGSILAELQKALGVNVSLARGSNGPAATSQVASSAGFGSSSSDGTATGQVLRVGTRLGSGLTLSYEQSLAGTESVVKLTLALGRRLSLVGQAGTDNAIDLFYNFRFGGTDRTPRPEARAD